MPDQDFTLLAFIVSGSTGACMVNVSNHTSEIYTAKTTLWRKRQQMANMDTFWDTSVLQMMFKTYSLQCVPYWVLSCSVQTEDLFSLRHGFV